MANLFSFGCHVIDRAFLRTYASTDCTVGVGDTIKGREGCLRRVLPNPHLLYLTFKIWSIDSGQNRIATDRSHVSIHMRSVSETTHRSDVIYLEAVRWPVNCFITSRTMFNLILLLVKLILYTYWTSMFWSIDRCQNRVPADKYHLTILRAQVSTHRGQVFFWSYPLTSY